MLSKFENLAKEEIKGNQPQNSWAAGQFSTGALNGGNPTARTNVANATNWEDGVAFARATGRTGGGARAGVLRMPLVPNAGSASGKSEGGRAKKISLDRTKHAASKHSKHKKISKANDEVADAGVTPAGNQAVPTDAAAQEGPGWSRNAAKLAEHRDVAAHSSQQKIKVVLKA